ncbi:M24 family metallopeptidase [Dubosiella newyorkensis]|jgi:Xaa-Pro aminopeptidase|uniref:M24 family metallopeptidase n=2 Tax=Dubosiella newyorkensis TaxID=1862672 RepID=UPI002356751E|nr:aminopeptidase P family protein [Dubosiella newyorkensis]
MMIELAEVIQPNIEEGIYPIGLTDETIELRKQAVLKRMEEKNIDSLVIWADLEHGSNFEYLVGFLPRFEEALLVLHKDGQAQIVLGNENLNKASKARIDVTAVHMPHFSLPNQPMEVEKSVEDILKGCKLEEDQVIGLVGWKNFTSRFDNNKELFDLPSFIVEALKKNNPNAKFINAADIFIGENGARTQNNANEFAHYEFGATLAGNCILNAMNQIEIGRSEMEVADALDAGGQPHSVVTIMATGARFEKANMYPTNKKIKKQDPLSITTGFKGGLQSRGGYAVSSADELPENIQDYIEVVAKPYFNAVVTWLENIKIGMKGKELYQVVDAILPKDQYGWKLNPGHLCADEEWLSSPIYPDSDEELKSGMLFQIDIIPSVPGYGGISCESGVMLADEELRKNIQEEYPEVWSRIIDRRRYMKEELGIDISEEIIPTSIVTAYCRPFLLNKEYALKNVK